MTASTLTNLISTNGYVRIQWTNASQPSPFYAWRLYQKRVGDPYWQKIYETTTASASYTVDSYAWAINVSQQIVLVGVSQNATTGVLTETAYTGANTFSYTGEAKYWLVHPTDPTKTVQFAIVTDDKFTIEVENEVIKLLDLNGEGGGRKVNVGANYGRVGTLSATIYDHTTLGTATAQRMKLEQLYQSGTTMWLRTPFGDLIPVFISEISGFERIAGLGTMEGVKVDVSYVALDVGRVGS